MRITAKKVLSPKISYMPDLSDSLSCSVTDGPYGALSVFLVCSFASLFTKTES